MTKKQPRLNNHPSIKILNIPPIRKFYLYCLFTTTYIGLIFSTGCSSSKDAFLRYKKAQAFLEQGEKNRRKLVVEGSEVLENFEKQVLEIWAKGLRLDPTHTKLRENYALLSMRLGVEYSIKSSRFRKNANALQKLDKKEAASVQFAKAKAMEKKAQKLLRQALNHFLKLKQMGISPGKINTYLGQTYFFLRNYSLAIYHLRSAIDSGELSPTRKRKLEKSILQIKQLQGK